MEEGRQRWRRPLYQWLCAVLCVWPLLSSCVSESVRPVVKIGLLAPFEGLHRRVGYEALAAMRQAIAIHSTHDIAMIPLALDVGGRPSQAGRTAQKLLADPTVQAVLGPYQATLIEQVRPVFADSSVPWFVPTRVDPSSEFVLSDSTMDWAISLIDRVATVAKERGQQRVVILGLPVAMQKALADQAHLSVLPLIVPINIPADLMMHVEQIEPGDALFWLGSPENGAALLSHLQERPLDVAFWLGPQGGNPVFAELVAITEEVYWATWLDSAYPAWQEQAAAASLPQSPAAYLTYRATEMAIATVFDEPHSTQPAWEIYLFALRADGTSQLWEPLHD